MVVRAAQIPSSSDPAETNARPLALVWSEDCLFLLSCSYGSTLVMLWSLDSADNAIDRVTEATAPRPPHVIYSHHSGREVSVCHWCPMVDDQRAFVTAGSDGQVVNLTYILIIKYHFDFKR